MTINDLKINEKAYVLKITAEGLIKRRLLDMGLTPQTEVTLVKKAPLGDPLEINIRGYSLSLRKTEASHVQLKKE